MKKRNLLLILFIAILAMACSNISATGSKNVEEYSLGKIYDNSSRRNITDALESYFENTKNMILKNIVNSPYNL